MDYDILSHRVFDILDTLLYSEEWLRFDLDFKIGRITYGLRNLNNEFCIPTSLYHDQDIINYLPLSP